MLYSALVLGIMGSLHCLGMCGPIAVMLPVSHKEPSKKRLQVSAYHFGRLVSYSILGALFGAIGKGLYVFGLQQWLSVIMGLVMVLWVLWPKQWRFYSPVIGSFYRLVGKVKSSLGTALHKKTMDAFLTMGVLNGLLPCGLVYMALVGATAMGNPAEGALYMALFGLGTVPLMTGVVYAKRLFSSALKQKVKRLIPTFVVLLGVLFIIRGLGLGIPYMSPKVAMASEMASGQIECHRP